MSRDEHAAFDRPRGRSRPRTKDRPSYPDAEQARVLTIDRGRYTLAVGDGHRPVTAMKSRPLGRQAVVVGDVVRVVGDTSGDAGTLARIVEVLPRATALRRTADDDDPVERVVVANAEVLVVVAALADPPLRMRLVDRCLVAAYDAGLEPLVCLTKSDLADAGPARAELAPLGVGVTVTGGPDGRPGSPGLDALRTALAGRTSVLIGHSGVGKSTLVNALVPEADRSISGVNAVTGRGRHTSTSAMALRLPGGGWIVDTPGFRSFGLAHIEVDDVLRAFVDLDRATRDCPRGCTHAETEPECALDTAAADGRITVERVRSFRRILASRLAADDV